MLHLDKFLRRRSRPALVTSAFGLICAIGALDYLTGQELSFSIFYLVPVSLAAWFAGGRYGILVSILAAAAWLAADLLAGGIYSHHAIPFWNAAVRLGFFIIVSAALSTLRASLARQEELTRFIVHDLRAPLANVMTGLQALQEIGGDATDSARKDMVERCLASSQRMLNLINSLLDLARLELGRMPLRSTQTSAQELVASALEQVSMWAAQRRLRLMTEASTDIESVYADPEVASRVLVNLLSNAIKTSRPESAVTLRVARSGESMVAFSVADRGPGVPRKLAAKLFEKYGQLGTRGSGSATGTGLGLAFCRQAIVAQGGRIWLESTGSEGSTVTFTLPTSSEKQGRTGDRARSS
jgi:signal transduction histidine kinase